MDDFILIAKAVSDPSRLRTLMVLRNGELCVCQIIALLQLAPSTVSKHMSILRNAGLITGRKQEKWMYYQLPEKPGLGVKKALQWIIASNEHDTIFKKDFNKIKTIKRKVTGLECREAV